MKYYQMTCGELLAGYASCGVDLSKMLISGLTLDSRLLKDGDAFIAVQGSAAHGLDFLESVKVKGPAIVIYEISEKYPQGFISNIPMIGISDLSKKVSAIASRFYGDPTLDMQVTAITGTNGKTTCAYLLTQLLNLLNVDVAMIGTLGSGRLSDLQNTGLTTPDAISLQRLFAEFRDTGVKHVVMEASSHALDQYRLDAVQVDVAAFTNLSQDHLDYHPDMDAYLQAKARLFHFESVNHAVLNADDRFYKKLRSLIPHELEVIEYSLDPEKTHTDFLANEIKSDSRKTRFTVLSKTHELQIDSNLIGNFNVANLMLVLSVAAVYGFSLEDLANQIMQLDAPKGRLQRLGNESTPTIVIDYAHTPDALENALQTLRPLTQNSLSAVFGCGGDRDKSKRPLMGMIAQNYADHIYLTDDNPRTESAEKILQDIQEGISNKNKLSVISDRAAAIHQSISDAAIEDVVLIAGKGHEEYQIINGEKKAFSDLLQAQAALSAWSGHKQEQCL